jgi:hypothetical protein
MGAPMSAKMLTAFAICSLAMAIVDPCGWAQAQQRTPNSTSAGMLRMWPENANWLVGLTRLLDGGLGCLLITGHVNPASGERYFWGMRLRDQSSLAVEVIDNNENAIASPSIKVMIDNVSFGTYPITRKLGPNNGLHTILAELPSPDNLKLLHLLGVGGTIQFVTANSTYTAPLLGARQSMQNLQECQIEAAHLSSTSAPR